MMDICRCKENKGMRLQTDSAPYFSPVMLRLTPMLPLKKQKTCLSSSVINSVSLPGGKTMSSEIHASKFSLFIQPLDRANSQLY